jgi:hypothetical protein
MVGLYHTRTPSESARNHPRQKFNNQKATCYLQVEFVLMFGHKILHALDQRGVHFDKRQREDPGFAIRTLFLEPSSGPIGIDYVDDDDAIASNYREVVLCPAKEHLASGIGTRNM